MEISLIGIVDKILGQYRAYGEHYGDMKAHDNLDNVKELLDHLVDNLCHNVEDGEICVAFSIVEVSKKSRHILENIKCMIEDVGI